MTFKNTTVNTKKFHFKVVALVFALASLLPFATPFVSLANAATLANSLIRLNRMSTNVSPDVTLVAFTVPASNAVTEDEVDVTFPGSAYFTVGTPTIATSYNSQTCAADLATGSTTYPSATILPGTFTSSTFTGQTVQVKGVTNLSASSTYCFYITSGLATGSSAVPNTAPTNQATIATKTSGATDDSSSFAMTTVSNDQIAVTAQVNPYFTFALSGNTDALGQLTQTAITSSASPNSVSVATNSKYGWIGWISSANAGLKSTAASKTINTVSGGYTYSGSPTTVAAGSEFYGLDASTKSQSGTGNGTLTVAPIYNGGATSVGPLTTAYDVFASSNGPANNDSVTLKLRASISAVTPPAGDYGDTLTVVGSGNF